jgi:hypothetical protein
MKLAAFVSDYRTNVDTLDRLTPEKLGIILVHKRERKLIHSVELHCRLLRG